MHFWKCYVCGLAMPVSDWFNDRALYLRRLLSLTPHLTLYQVRHGAATALREVIKLHGGTAGTSVYTSASQQDRANQKWLVDAAIRFLCVFSLDRFADFVSDQVRAQP